MRELRVYVRELVRASVEWSGVCYAPARGLSGETHCSGVCWREEGGGDREMFGGVV